MARSARHIPWRLRNVVRDRAGGKCEYCKYPDAACYASFQIDHFNPRRTQGSTLESNLVWACPTCNASKAGHRFGRDPETGRRVAIFNPRRDDWADHFEWSDDSLEIVGKTPKGRGTAELLEMNRPKAKQIRSLLVRLGLHPPE